MFVPVLTEATNHGQDLTHGNSYRCDWMDMSGQIYAMKAVTPRKESLYRSNGGLGGSHSRPGYFLQEIKSFPLPEVESLCLVRPVYILPVQNML